MGSVDVPINVLGIEIRLICFFVYIIFPTAIRPSMYNLPLKQLTINKLLLPRPAFHYFLLGLHPVSLFWLLFANLLSLSLLDRILVDSQLVPDDLGTVILVHFFRVDLVVSRVRFLLALDVV